MINIRDTRQNEFAELYLKSNRRNICHIAPRFGKTRLTIKILEKLNPKKILICYPDAKIMASWVADFEEMEFDSSNVEYTTYLSLWKLILNSYDIIIMDEIHLCHSDKQIEAAKELLQNNPSSAILGLSGTISKATEHLLLDELNLPILINYPIEKAISEGIIVDYEISVIKVSLDSRLKIYKGKSEKQKFDALSYVIDKLENEGKDTFFLRLQRMRLIQNSIAKKNKTKELLKQFSNERVLTFCGVTKIADELGIPSFHSKSTEKQIFKDFVEGNINQLSVVRIGNSGVTYPNLNKVIINYFDSNGQNMAQKINRCMGMEYNNPNKKAQIWLISTTESVEQRWLSRALEFFDPSKVKYL